MRGKSNGHTYRQHLVPALFATLFWMGFLGGPAGAEAGGDDTYAPKGPVPPGYTVIEGDILVPLDRYKPGATYITKLWPGGIVPFEFDGNVSAQNQSLMLAAMAEWEAVANVDFRPRSDEGDYVHIQNSTANNSAVGMQERGEQIINIRNWNAKFIMAHELAHCLAFWHEQAREDRDTYVQIHMDRVCQTCCSGESCDNNFEIRPEGGEYGPYDFDSVMHYGQCSFSVCMDCALDPVNCRTITVRSPYDQWQSLIGQRDHLSYLDRTTMSFLYPEWNWRFADAWFPFEGDGTFFRPYSEFQTAVTNTPTNGTLWLQPGTYSAVGTYSRAMTIRAPLGSVTLGN